MIFADIIARRKKCKGKCFFSAGLDEYGSKIEERAEKENKEPQVFVDEITKTYLKAWDSLAIIYSDFIRTTSAKHKTGVLEFIKKLYDKGDIYEGEYEGLYCVGCENFVLERMVNGLCPTTSPSAENKREKSFLQSQKISAGNKKKNRKRRIENNSESRKTNPLAIIESGVSDFSITREGLKWGYLSLMIKNQAIYVWVDALINYATVLIIPTAKISKNIGRLICILSGRK